MSETIELQTCEHCSKGANIETMTLMESCWFCADCTADFQKTFDACDHEWSPHTDEMGDPGQVCGCCTGFVRNEDFPSLFGKPAPLLHAVTGRTFMSTATLDSFIREIPSKLEAILRREIVSAKCGEYTVERTMSGILMSSPFARVVAERLSQADQ